MKLRFGGVLARRLLRFALQLGDTYRCVEAPLSGHVPVVDGHEPSHVSKTPANSAFLQKLRKPTPNRGILSIRQRSRSTSDLLEVASVLHVSLLVQRSTEKLHESPCLRLREGRHLSIYNDSRTAVEPNPTYFVITDQQQK
jgi:hypothetical protein